MKNIAPETPAVVVSTKGVSLADKLRLSELPLATTAGGKAFTYEALHPSSHEYPMTRVPGGNMKSVAVRCDMVEDIDIVDDGTAVDVAVIPSPMVPATIATVPPAGVTTPATTANFYNAALGGSFKIGPTAVDTRTFVAGFSSAVSAYRITAQSVTVELIASDLINQGSITAYQARLPPLTGSPGQYRDPTDSSDFGICHDYVLYPEPPVPSEGLMGTTAYTSKAKEGCYMPLKLTSFKWRDTLDRAAFFSCTRAQAIAPNYQVIKPAVGAPLVWPWYENRSTVLKFGDYPASPKLCGHNFGLIRLSGLRAGVSVRVRVRQVLEISARPGTIYAPLLEPSLPPDETAVRMYEEISARMQDAYPASYNDLGKLKSIIAGLAKKVLPYVDPALDWLSNSSIPVIGTGAKIAKTALGAGRQIAAVVNESKKAKRAAAAAQKK
jgi:hypothetical protein